MRPHSDLWVVVPCYNEEKRVADTLRALATQTDDDFTLLIVDNGSTDRTCVVVHTFFGEYAPSADLSHSVERGTAVYRIITEAEEGTGAAADTGFRYAIAHGARW